LRESIQSLPCLGRAIHLRVRVAPLLLGGIPTAKAFLCWMSANILYFLEYLFVSEEDPRPRTPETKREKGQNGRKCPLVEYSPSLRNRQSVAQSSVAS